ncbi:MAG: hypothetical protein AVDCRST_MAG01-01-2126 [uncultured Rubrobacteraceae bacterium]|uniref:Tryptophan-rich sensory protein n=1 Tax=uncultured Rubrobacteraceae bacterium TaxID=349277 RepID=A0A6J4PNB9_9ACTN|nr:MAG: hypothetical protein AVDCRST_MAG01-01-2126 [uncultured Rubrobacteraceae bacterium]
MRTNSRMDRARQAATIVGVVLQVGGGALAGGSVGRVSAENPTLVVPADYAFVVWGPIFALSLAYSVYQALPQQRQNPLLRRVGWFVAGAFAGNGLRQILFPAELFVASQALLAGIVACAVAALLGLGLGRVYRERGLGWADRWLVALPVGLFAGWVTAAVFVGVATTLVGTGFLDGGPFEAILGVILLIVGVVVASVVVRSARRGRAQGYVAYAGAVLWALVAVVANQYDASSITTVAAALGVVLVALALLAPLRSRGPRNAMRNAS